MRIFTALLFTVIATAFMGSTLCHAQQVKPVSGFPSDEEGYDRGVSACYAGRIGPWMIMAGGCNFTAEGQKKYYRGVYAARVSADTLHWQRIGTLPEAAAYGVTAASADSLLLIGGSNADGSLSTVLSLHISRDGSQATLRTLPSIPHTIDNMAVAQHGHDIFIVGGNCDGRPSDGILRLRLGRRGNTWSRIGTMPNGARVQPVAVCMGRKLYVWGGFHAKGDSSEVHTDGLMLHTRSGKMTPLCAPHDEKGHPITLSGGTAWTDGEAIWATGGVNHDIFLDAISGRYHLVKRNDYLSQPIAWYKFNPLLLRYSPHRHRWQVKAAAHQQLARAGAAALFVRGFGCFYIGGELKPTVRTPQVVRITQPHWEP